ncbi:E3 ubiquitin/ISG15 ligase TRIM25 [Xenopus tropicalis]|uniref:E3 ubiquitin/ISG15 ligase TRIM25 n=1 Tax=Xenopus tropicalis TaxID=8364 RepID=A0A8J0QZ30_XENTR|nr:E3 ubiquitin/ISG15 ligase TRIM25 [Xenopus tropicalis]
MAAADLRDELNCSICLSIYTDPVSLPCDHNFCRGCIGAAWDTQGGSGSYSCPECRAEYPERPALERNKILADIAEQFLSTDPEHDGTGIFCTYCVHSPVPAAKSCLQCETSMCDAHVKVHSKSAEHVLTEPTTNLGNRKCFVHDELLKYFCNEDSAYICVSCYMFGEHKTHHVVFLNEIFEKKTEKMKNILDKLIPERDEIEKSVQSLQERQREVEGKAAGEAERVTALFRDIKDHLEALEKQVLSEISKQEEQLTLQILYQIQQLEIKKDELSRKIRRTEELCNMAESVTILYGRATDKPTFCDAQGVDNEGKGRDDQKDPVVGDVDEGFISDMLLRGLGGIGAELNKRIYGQEATDMLLDIHTAGNNVFLSDDYKMVFCSKKDQRRPRLPQRFQYPQVLSTRSFPSGRHYWQVEGRESGGWGVGAAYPSIERTGTQSWIGNNKNSWCLYRGYKKYSVRHNNKVTDLPHVPSSQTIRISLDYEAGRLSFYELSEPIRHLHTFTTSFTEPLHGAFWVGLANLKLVT